jgi:hypothetical protein
MPVIADSPVTLTVDDVTASWGTRRARLASARMTAIISNLLAQIEACHWIQPKISFEVWPVVARTRERLDLSSGASICSPTLGHFIPGATHVAAGVCTIGAAIENHVSEGFAASDRLQSVILDEIGTLALFRVGERLESLVQAEAARLGLDASGPLSPGEDGIDISQQATVLGLAGGARIGLSNTTIAMLTPRKSASMIFGLGSRMRKWNRSDRCAVCAARDRCPHWRSRLVEVGA